MDQKRRRQEWMFKTSVLVQAAFMLVVLWFEARDPHRWVRGSDHLKPHMLRALATMAFMYGLALAGAWGTQWEGRARGRPKGATRLSALQTFAALGVFVGLCPATVVGDTGWDWAAPLYGLYFLYLVHVWVRWWRYRQAEGSETGARAISADDGEAG